MVIKKSIVLATIAAVVLATISFFFFDDGSIGNNDIKKAVGSEEDSYRKDNLESKNENIGIIDKLISAISSGFGGGGGGGESSEGSCINLQISYALKNFNETFSCLAYVNGKCVSLSANCSMEINHLDIDVGPREFVVRYDLTDKFTEEILGTNLFQETIEFEESILFTAEFNLEDANGINENLECAFETIIIPRKEVCS
ncbi:MAG: hypothetical protein IH845_05285 [Nanoarchaeota archaeon]|nr:hypothetical protein [Nanoarchaeota archaeon]